MAATHLYRPFHVTQKCGYVHGAGFTLDGKNVWQWIWNFLALHVFTYKHFCYSFRIMHRQHYVCQRGPYNEIPWQQLLVFCRNNEDEKSNFLTHHHTFLLSRIKQACVMNTFGLMKSITACQSRRIGICLTWLYLISLWLLYYCHHRSYCQCT